MSLDRRFYFISFTSEGGRLVENLIKAMAESFLKTDVNIYDNKNHLNVHDFIKDVFEHNATDQKSCLVMVGAVGISVRLIAPFIKDKLTDPAVIAIDDLGRFVISLLSGHIGGANALSELISEKLKAYHYTATPVITTATDIRGLRGIESLLQDYKVPLSPIREDLKKLNMHIAEGGVIYIAVDPMLGLHHSESPSIKNYTDSQKILNGDKLVAISFRRLESWFKCHERHILDYHFISKSLIIGTGCKKNFPKDGYINTLIALLEVQDFDPKAIQAISSISLKKQETCILEAAEHLQSEVMFHEIETLEDIAMNFEGSDFVLSKIGIGSVAGPCAFKMTGDTMTLTVYKMSGCTFSFGRTLR